jgi:type I restriction enzyme R subunit
MSEHGYNEEQLVERPAIELFAQLGWQTVLAFDELFGPGGTLQRETSGEVVLLSRLHPALQRLNPNLPAEGISTAVNQLTRDRSAMSLATANRDVYELLKQGVQVSVPDPARGGQRIERVRVIDWEKPVANDFLLVSQMTISGQLYTCRPDLIGFVNGLPLVVMEFKKPGVAARAALEENITSYKHPLNGVPALFWFNELIIASNGSESRVGSITADWDRMFEWKRIEREDEPRRISLETLICGTCAPPRLLDLVENFTVFSEHKTGLVKILGQNHQVLGVNNAIASMLLAREEGHGRGGVFWQTQGSGKSLAMVFFSQKVLRKIPGNWTFVVVTDRVELDNQIAKTFKATGAVSQKEGDECHAESGSQLRDLLHGNHRFVFTLIQKFLAPEELSNRRDIIVLTDEAHRTQYDTLAMNMRSALPNAIFLAFTGTPLIAGEERTREVFGDYVSIYDFQQSVEDGATVPLFYENRTPELKLKNPSLNEDIYALIEEAQLDDEAENKLERELGRQYHTITRDDRLDKIAKDVVTHFLDRGFQGKAMVVSIDKATALKMHNKVRKCWEEEQRRVEDQLAKLGKFMESDPDKVRALNERLGILKSTDMAVVVSPGQNEVEEVAKLGLDIVPHRKRMNSEPLDEKFKDPDDPLRIAFVCAMWMTGFDAPSCSTMYIDKPLRNHTLMQTIARANRVFPGKHSGKIVDYANVFASLEKALAIYGAGKGGTTPVRDKSVLLVEFKKALGAATDFCGGQNVDLNRIESAAGFDRVKLICDAVDALISPDPLRREFLTHERLVGMFFRAVKPDPVALEFVSRVSCLAVIADEIRMRTGGGRRADISVIMSKVNEVLDESIAADGFHIRSDADGLAIIDLAKIDFEVLAKRFKQSNKKNLDLEQLKAAVRAQLEKMIRINKTRADYLAKFEELIESYNAGSRNIEELFQELLALSRALTEEQQRHVREQLTEDELTVFDILTRPGPDLTPEERDEVKKVARQLLQKLKSLLVLEWRHKAQARAQVRLAIEDVLDEGLPRAYSREFYKQKCSALFEHVFENSAQLEARVA